MAGWRATARVSDAERLRWLHHVEHGDCADQHGSIDAYAYALTQLILDISGYFAP